MNKYTYAIGVSALALVMGGVPVIALAEEGGREAEVRVNATAQVTSVSVDDEGTEGSDDDTASSTEGAERVVEQVREQAKQRLEITREMFKDSLEFLREDATSVRSFDELKRGIEERRHELDDEEASTTPEARDIVKNANPVRLAVHALLASKDLLGGIGPRVSEIAREMNDSVATTTRAEAKIQSRGFFSRFFFGGDDTAAEVISQAVARNQERVQVLTNLLAEAGVSAEVKAELEARIAALGAAQARLSALAEKEQKAWGLFSWRF